MSHQGYPGKPGQESSGGTGGVGGVGGTGGDPGGTGGPGGEGGSVYVDSRYVARWVRTVWIGFTALVIAISLSFYLFTQEHDQRVKDNEYAITLINAESRLHRNDDRVFALVSVKADCARARALRQLLLTNGYLTTPRGRAGLNQYVLHASRVGCTLTP